MRHKEQNAILILKKIQQAEAMEAIKKQFMEGIKKNMTKKGDKELPRKEVKAVRKAPTKYGHSNEPIEINYNHARGKSGEKHKPSPNKKKEFLNLPEAKQSDLLDFIPLTTIE
jgi:hypothetical protein